MSCQIRAGTSSSDISLEPVRKSIYGKAGSPGFRLEPAPERKRKTERIGYRTSEHSRSLVYLKAIMNRARSYFEVLSVPDYVLAQVLESLGETGGNRQVMTLVERAGNRENTGVQFGFRSIRLSELRFYSNGKIRQKGR